MQQRSNLAASEQVASESPASKPRMEGRVLVVDDMEPKRYLLAHHLRAAGMEVWEAASGAEALEAAARQPDVVVMDVRLPDLSGFEVCRRLKADAATAAIPVLYVSTLMEDKELEARLFADGADGYLPQPVEPRHLLAQTWALVRMRRAEQARQQQAREAEAERRRAEQRVAELLGTTVVFANALTRREVADGLVAHGLGFLGAFAGMVCVVSGEALHVLSHYGYPEALVESYRVQPLSQSTPITEAVRTGRAVWVETPEAFVRDWPGLADAVRGSSSFSWVMVPLPHGERVVGALGLSFPTARRFSEQEQEHLESICRLGAQALERARLYEEERRAKEEVRRRAELEQQLIGMVSHDLRNPLQAILLSAHLLQRMEHPSLEVLRRKTERIVTSADTMGRMVSDLLDFTRGRLAGGIPLERAENDLVLLCREVLEEFTLTHPGCELRFDSEGPCTGRWDGPRMRQVVSNLLSNAVRHARAGTAVRVGARYREAEVELSVENEGEPIPPEVLPVLFEPFNGGVRRSRPAGSLGLGLYIVHQVVVGHGGTVEVASGEGRTTFTVRVPRGT